jgi:tetratricopeptide (TPR) repeat protein
MNAKLRTTICTLTLAAMLSVLLPMRAQTTTPPHPSRPQAAARTLSPQAKLKQYLADLKNTPDDTALREKIIKLVLTMKPAPMIPQEAQNELSKGQSGLANTGSWQEAYRDALAQFGQAALLAPWWPDAYYNLAGVQEKLDKLEDARSSLRLYLLAAPDATDADSGRQKIAALDPEERLKQAVAVVRSNPNDTAAREKVIRLALVMKSPPEIPEEAREHFVMAQAFKEKATVSTGFTSAIQEYKAALLDAPWWAEAYKKLAIVQKAADQYDDAIASLSLYLVSQPSDARDARDEIYKLKADKQAAAQAAAAQAAAAEQQRRQREEENSPQRKLEALLRKIDGRRYTFSGGPVVSVIDINGRFLTEGQIWPPDITPGPGHFPGYNKVQRVEIQGRVTNYSMPAVQFGSELIRIQLRYTISEEGDTITWHRSSNSVRFPDEEHVLDWQR